MRCHGVCGIMLVTHVLEESNKNGNRAWPYPPKGRPAAVAWATLHTPGSSIREGGMETLAGMCSLGAACTYGSIN